MAPTGGESGPVPPCSPGERLQLPSSGVSGGERQDVAAWGGGPPGRVPWGPQALSAPTALPGEEQYGSASPTDRIAQAVGSWRVGP